MAGSVVERYLRLGLQLGRHVEGIVDAYFGPPELAAAVDDAPPVDAGALVTAAERLLDELEDSWLRDQAIGLRTYAGVLAGERRSYADEVEGCYGVRPTHTDEAVFAAAHERLAELLPGPGPLAERYRRWQESTSCPPSRWSPRWPPSSTRRRWTRRLVELPDGEGVVVEVVRDKPWLGSCEYLGGLRSRIAINLDMPMSALELLRLTSHETCPGHHAERTAKDDLLVRGRGLLEETLVLLPTPQSLVAGGSPSSRDRAARGRRRAGVRGDRARRGHRIRPSPRPGRGARPRALRLGGGQRRADAARRRSERGGRAGLPRALGLLMPALATHVIRFLGQPTSRTYVMNYSAGRELCRSYVAADPERFRRLLTEQVRVGGLLEAARGPRRVGVGGT